MNKYLITDAISYLDADLLAKHLEKKENLKNKASIEKKKSILKWSDIAAACLVVVILATFVVQYIPVSYELDYNYTGSNGEDVYILDKNVWIYYVDGSNIRRERVNLPCTAENIFITWKYLNDIGDDVVLISYQINSNGIGDSSSFEGEDVDNYKQGNYRVLNITISKNIENYIEGKNYNNLITSLKRSMTEYSNLEFDDVNVAFE
jgi:hypothetical protein